MLLALTSLENQHLLNVSFDLLQLTRKRIQANVQRRRRIEVVIVIRRQDPMPRWRELRTVAVNLIDGFSVLFLSSIGKVV
ncbi:hypothetical protein XM50_18970 [Sphingomonas sp. Ag1]|nr:hypothetical protein XM50_18970 [Sphingomonas sp. Ag1]